MANLNLSEFTEKTFVADADWTFVWDTAGAISKKVSRNSLLSVGSIATSTPVTITQTWTDVAQTFKALVVNAAGTSDANSASGSLLLDLQVGGVSKLWVTKNGTIKSAANSFLLNVAEWGTSNQYQIRGDGVFIGAQFSTASNSVKIDTVGIALKSDIYFGFCPADAITGVPDTRLFRDGAANTLALRNGAAAQTFNVYGTFTTATTNFERLAIKYNATDVAYQIAAEKGSTNGDYRPLDFVTGGSRRMVVTSAGSVGVGDIDQSTSRYPQSAFEVIKSSAINAPLITLRSSLTTVGSWASISFGDQSQLSNYRKGALIYESTSGAANGKFHIALQNLSDAGNATIADARLTVLPGGNVGIGTTAPGSTLSVVGNGSFRNTGSALGTGYGIEFDTNSSLPRFSFVFNSVYASVIEQQSDSLRFKTLGSGITNITFGSNSSLNQVVLKTDTGNLGIGTTAPSSKLHVAGTIKPEQATMVDKAAGFTLAAVDAGTIINSTSATAITINLPAADTATGYNVMIIQSGAGPVTIGQNGNTLNSFGGAAITAGQHAACSIVRTAASTYNLSGNLV